MAEESCTTVPGIPCRDPDCPVAILSDSADCRMGETVINCELLPSGSLQPVQSTMQRSTAANPEIIGPIFIQYISGCLLYTSDAADE